MPKIDDFFPTNMTTADRERLKKLKGAVKPVVILGQPPTQEPDAGEYKWCHKCKDWHEQR